MAILTAIPASKGTAWNCIGVVVFTSNNVHDVSVTPFKLVQNITLL